MKPSILLLPLLAFASGCATRAPTAYELDRRAGLTPSAEIEEGRLAAHEVRQARAAGKPMHEPSRSPPRLARVWVYDQELDGGFWLQGTHVFLEVEPGQWLEPELTGENP